MSSIKSLSRRQFIGLASSLIAASAMGTLTACGGGGGTSQSASTTGGETGGLDLSNWDAVLEAANGTDVTYAGYGQTTAINDYFTNTFAPTLESKYGVGFKYLPQDATADMITILADEKQAGKELGEGTLDTCWFSGTYFDEAKQNELLWGDYLQYLPNMQYYNADSKSINYDQGSEIGGRESLFATSYFALVYDADKVDEADVPHNAQELLEYAKAHPGRVTYSAPPDYQGCYMAANIVMDICGADCFEFDTDVTEDEMKEALADGLSFLRDLNPYLWKEGKTYPSSFSDWCKMFKDGDVDFVYDQAWVQAPIEAGQYPENAHAILLDKVLSQPHYLAVPYDCPNLAAALVMCNEFLDPEGMCARAETGYPPAVDAMNLDALTDAQKTAIEECELKYGQNAPTLTELGANAVPLFPAWTEEVWHNVWKDEVASQTN